MPWLFLAAETKLPRLRHTLPRSASSHQLLTGAEMVTRKKNGSPDSKHFEAPDIIAKFEPVKQWLVRNCRKVGAGGAGRNLRVGRERRKLNDRLMALAAFARASVLFNAHHCALLFYHLMHKYVFCHSLTQYTQADPPSSKNLAMLVCVMLQFQEVSSPPCPARCPGPSVVFNPSCPSLSCRTRWAGTSVTPPSPSCRLHCLRTSPLLVPSAISWPPPTVSRRSSPGTLVSSSPSTVPVLPLCQ